MIVTKMTPLTNRRYYLCGPIDTAGHREENLKQFREAAFNLRSLSYHIVSPIETEPDQVEPEYMDYIKKDLIELVNCDAIVLLPGWPQSKGARGELQLAMQLDKPVFFYIANTVTLVDMNFR